jgi:RimJ/RimL family protein N-acetyltransferase
MRIEGIAEGDLPVVVPLLFRALVGGRGALPSEAALANVLKESIQAGRRGDYCVLVARPEQGGIQGVIATGPMVTPIGGVQTNNSELRMLAAMPDGSGRRLGQVLLDRLQDELRTRGHQALWASGSDEMVSPLIKAGATRIRQEPSGNGPRQVVRLQVAPWPDELETERLRLRAWSPGDFEAFAAMNGDPEVMRYLPGTLAPDESDELAERMQGQLARAGYGVWALTLKDRGEGGTLIGCAGYRPTVDLPFSPAPEVVYRLATPHWGQGLATEAMRAVLAHACALGFFEVVGLTTPSNARSRRVLEKVGMTRDPQDDLDHPAFPAGHPMARHMLYRFKNT